jgi:DNA ligase-1
MLTDVPYMRCCLPADTDLKSFPWSGGVYSQMKADGMFANLNVDADGVVTLASRNGSPFPMDMFTKLAVEAALNISPGYQLHGELLMYRDGKLLERKTSNGRFNSILQGGELEAGDVPIYVAWDMIPIAEAKAKSKYKVTYATRLSALEASIGGNKLALGSLRLIDYRLVNSIEAAYAHYKTMLAEGYEGTIIKHPFMIWEDTTSKHQVKLKLTAECDLKIVSFTEGNGKNAKTFGSIQCVSSDGKLEVGVSGFSDALRQEFSDDRANMIGKIMTVKSNAIMVPKKEGDKYSLFLPRFEEIRLDKRTADDLSRVQQQFDAAVASVAG